MLVKNCFWCKNTKLSKVSLRLDKNPILQCKGCGLSMVGNLPSKIDDLYKKDYFEKTDQDQRYGYVNYLSSSAANLLGKYAFVRLISPDFFKTHLDLGCANGSLMEIFESNKYDTTGLEISKEAVEIAKSKGLKVDYSNLNKYPFTDKSFDFITAFDLIEHLKTPRETLLETSRVLKDKGIFFYSTLNIKSFSPKEYWFNTSLEHFIYYDSKILVKLLEDIFGKGNVCNIEVKNGGGYENFGIAKKNKITQEEKLALELIKKKGIFPRKEISKNYFLSLIYNQLSLFDESKKALQMISKKKPRNNVFLEFMNLYFQGKFDSAYELIKKRKENIPLNEPLLWQAENDVLELKMKSAIASQNQTLEKLQTKITEANNLKEELNRLKNSNFVKVALRLKELKSKITNG